MFVRNRDCYALLIISRGGNRIQRIQLGCWKVGMDMVVQNGVLLRVVLPCQRMGC